MNWFTKIIRSLFLVKEIVSKEGAVHFRRYRLLWTPWFALYIHQILRSDQDEHLHTHPWNFISFILKGSYMEEVIYALKRHITFVKMFPIFSLVHHNRDDAHHITLMDDCVWSLVFTYGKWKTWGYQTEQGFIDFKTYRKMKNEGAL